MARACHKESVFRSPVIEKLEHTMEKPSLFSNCITFMDYLFTTSKHQWHVLYLILPFIYLLAHQYIHHHVLGITEDPYVKPALFLNKFNKISNWEMLLKTHT